MNKVLKPCNSDFLSLYIKWAVCFPSWLTPRPRRWKQQYVPPKRWNYRTALPKMVLMWQPQIQDKETDSKQSCQNTGCPKSKEPTESVIAFLLLLYRLKKWHRYWRKWFQNFRQPVFYSYVSKLIHSYKRNKLKIRDHTLPFFRFQHNHFESVFLSAILKSETPSVTEKTLIHLVLQSAPFRPVHSEHIAQWIRSEFCASDEGCKMRACCNWAILTACRPSYHKAAAITARLQCVVLLVRILDGQV